MRLILIGLAMGIGCWQLMPELLTQKQYQISIFLLVILNIFPLAIAYILKQSSEQILINQLRNKIFKYSEGKFGKFIFDLTGYTYLFSICFVYGFLFSAWRAELRMEKTLPLPYEGRVITLVGLIKGLPVVNSESVSFKMLVSHTQPRIENFPEKVSLTWYPEKKFADNVLQQPLISAIERYSSRSQVDQYLENLSLSNESNEKFIDQSKFSLRQKNDGESLRLLLKKHDNEIVQNQIDNLNKIKVLSSFKAGQIWQIKARLKRPRSEANFGSFDWASRFLQQNIQARGYIIDKPQPQYLGNYFQPQFKNFFSNKADSNRVQQNALLNIKWLQLKDFIVSTKLKMQLKVDEQRSLIAKKIFQLLPNAVYSSIIVALAIGEQNQLNFKTREILSVTGTSHLLAISGLHVGLVSGFVSMLISFFWRHFYWRGSSLCLVIPAQRVAAFAGVVTAIVYVALAGFGIPAQRALWMIIVVFSAYALNRCVPITVVLSWALLLVIIIDPWAPLTIGFWLSFSAVAIISIIIFQDQVQQEKQLFFLKNENHFDKFKKWLNEFSLAVRVQLALSCALAPLTVYWFNKFSIISPLANAFAIPLVSFLIVPLVLLGVLLPAPFDHYLLHTADYFIHVLMAFLTKLNDMGIAGIDWIKPPLWIVVIASCGAACVFLPIATKWRLLSLSSCLPFLLYRHEVLPNGEFRLTAMDVGQGMAVLIETKNHRFIFDTGPTLGRSDSGEKFILPYLKNLGIDQLDGVMVSHNHSDHTGGAATLLLSRTVKNFFGSLPPAHFLWAIANYRQTKTFDCVAGKNWNWDGVSFEIIWPKADIFSPKNIVENHSINGTSCVLRIKTKHLAALLPGDLERKQEQIVSSLSFQNNLPKIQIDSMLVRKAEIDIEPMLITEDEKKRKSEKEKQLKHKQNKKIDIDKDIKVDVNLTQNLNKIPEVISSQTALSSLQINQFKTENILKADILIAPHHGSNTSSSLNFVRQVMPSHVIFQVGYKNRFRHPHPAVYSRYEKLGAKLYRNDYDGAIRFTTKQKAIKVERYRKQYRRYWNQ